MKQEEKQKIVLIIGDIILDKTYFGNVSRISPEAPCPVFDLYNDVAESLGGAAYVASQLAALSINVSLCGTIANDTAGKSVRGLLEERGIYTELVFSSAEQTTTKNRYITKEKWQQVFRVDLERQNSIQPESQKQVLSYIKENASVLDYVVLIDYDKGVLSNCFCQDIIRLCNQLMIPTFVDIKSSSYVKYKGAGTVKGNQREIQQMLLQLNILDNDYLTLKKRLECANLIMTCGADGISYVDAENKSRHEQGIPINLFDVTGAGDIVSAFYIASLISGKSIHEAIKNANRAASIKVGTFGCPILTWAEIREKKTKLITITDFLMIKSKGNTIVFTNGCFDVLHVGHIDLLKKAATYGDLLIVGINSDSSIRRIKGDGRPINNLESRISVLSAIECVDYIIVFEEDTPMSIIQKIRPNVLVKGGDYIKEQVVGAEFVESNGGAVMIVPFIHDISSSIIINKLK